MRRTPGLGASGQGLYGNLGKRLVERLLLVCSRLEYLRSSLYSPPVGVRDRAGTPQPGGQEGFRGMQLLQKISFTSV